MHDRWLVIFRLLHCLPGKWQYEEEEEITEADSMMKQKPEARGKKRKTKIKQTSLYMCGSQDDRFGVQRWSW